MDLEKQAIDILKCFSSEEPYQLGYSGGKDSSVILHLANKSGVKFEAVHNHTTVDAPETVYYVRQMEKRGLVRVEYPKESMWQLIVRHKTPPTRIMRYCCQDLKEYSGKGKKLITGVRKFESRNRAQNQGIITFTKPNKEIKSKVDNENFHLTSRGGVVVLNYENSESHRVVENCYRTSKTLVNPILEWDDDFLWWYIRNEKIDINPLYKGGAKDGCGRIGCIGCPMAGKGRWKEFEQYPKYKEAYIRAFDRMIIARREKGLKCMDAWSTGLKVFKWWMEDENISGQYSFGLDGDIAEDYLEY